MADCCTNCFYLVKMPFQTSAGKATKTVCAFAGPLPGTDINSAIWPIIQFPDEMWCGVGCDTDSGTPFNAPVRPPSGTATNGTFTLTNQSSATITDTNSKTTSNIKVWWINPPAGQSTPAIIATPGAGTFGVATQGGLAVTGSFGYTIYN